MARRFDPDLDHRRSVRLAGHDYARAATIFVTICTFQRQLIFGEIAGGRMAGNELSRIVTDCWEALPAHF
jgi:hypothetical protein